MSIDFESARRKYKPDNIRFLFVAEAPPRAGSGRFFYFEDVRIGDSLFLETMKVLYPNEYTDTSIVRLQKKQFLKRFQSDGFYLIDSTDVPMLESSPSYKRRQIKSALPSLREKLSKLAVGGVKVILISAPVYDICASPLRTAGFNVINQDLIDFPGSGGQVKFRDKLSSLLVQHGWLGAVPQRIS